MRKTDRNLTSIPELLAWLKEDCPTDEPVWFRGQADVQWQLTPSLGRLTNGLEKEPLLMKRFKQHALAFLESRPASEWEWLFIMQHHGVPTRLLDWTENALVGLHFAVYENPHSNGALWCMLPAKLNKNAHIQLELKNDIPGFDSDQVLDDYLPNALQVKKMLHNPPIAAIAARNTRRMQAQRLMPLLPVRSAFCRWTV